MSRHPVLRLIAAIVSVAGLAAFGCAEGPGPSDLMTPGPGQPLIVEDPCGAVTSVILYAGQSIDVGTVTVANDGIELCVTYQTTGDWYITESHLHIATTLSDIPQTRSGNPKVGKFAHSRVLDPPVQTDEYCFPLTELGYTAGTHLYIAAHAVVERQVEGSPVQEETAWGDGLPFPGNNWATYLFHAVQECNGEDTFEVGEHRTHTQGQWGDPSADCSADAYIEDLFGGNPECFTWPLVVGWDQGYQVTLTGPDAVRGLLPAVGTPAPLTQDWIDPPDEIYDPEDTHAQQTEAGLFLGEVIALTLNIVADACNPDYATGDIPLGSLYICIPNSDFQGITVQELLDEANILLGGGWTGHSVAEIASLLQVVNSNFDPCNPPGSLLCETPVPPGGSGGSE